MKKKLLLVLVLFMASLGVSRIFAKEVFVACPPDFPKCASIHTDPPGSVVDTIKQSTMTVLRYTEKKEPVYSTKLVEYAGKPQTTYYATYKISGVNKPSIALLCVPNNQRRPRCCTTQFSPDKDIEGGIVCNVGETLKVQWRNYASPPVKANTGKILVTKTSTSKNS